MSKVTKNVPEKIRLGQFFLKGDVRHKLERVANGSFFARSCQDGQVYAMTRCEIEQDGKYSFIHSGTHPQRSIPFKSVNDSIQLSAF
ncbi:MAG: hypothetical protein CMP48_25195 [Rickettsiales bacterium]|nr:hypothetical protein [Rickettsiales bacterium]